MNETAGEQAIRNAAGKIEIFKLWIDYFKQLTALSTGSIVLIATFLEKLFAQPRWKPAAIISLGGFSLSILGSLVVLAVLILMSSRMHNPAAGQDAEKGYDSETLTFFISMVLTSVAFLVGIIALTAFTIRNLL